MKNKLFKKILSTLCAISISSFGCISVGAVKTRPQATSEMNEPVDACNTQLKFVEDTIYDSSLKLYAEKNLKNSSKIKDLITQIKCTIEPLKDLYVNDVDEANSLKNALRELYDHMLALKNYINQPRISQEEFDRHIRTAVIKGIAVSSVKVRILLNAEALSMQK